MKARVAAISGSPGARGWRSDSALGGSVLTRARRVLTSILCAAFCGSALVGGTASAELPPSPVEPGDFYFSAGVALYYINAESFETARGYLDDNFTGAGVSTDNDRGFLLSYETDEERLWAPEIQLGFALEEAPFDGKLGSAARWHVSAYGYQRSGDSTVAYMQPQANYGELINPNTGLPELRNLGVFHQPIDGADTLPNGDASSFFHIFALEDNRVRYDDLFVNSNVMFFFDDPEGALRLTRGVGLTVGYERSEWDWRINSPQLAAFAPGLGPASWTYDFDLNTFYLGPRAEFSYGWEPVRVLSFFVNGGFAPMMAITRVDGTQRGMCLSACTINGGASTGTAGVSTLSETDVSFAYDVRAEAGMSIYLWVLRLSGTLGVFAGNQFTMPEEQTDGSYETKFANQWGYFLRGVATVSF